MWKKAINTKKTQPTTFDPCNERPERTEQRSKPADEDNSGFTDFRKAGKERAQPELDRKPMPERNPDTQEWGEIRKTTVGKPVFGRSSKAPVKAAGPPKMKAKPKEEASEAQKAGQEFSEVKEKPAKKGRFESEW
jgi:hypothetical protein